MDINQLQSHMVLMLEESIERDIPSSVTQDYWRWSLSEQNPKRDLWVKTLGIPQFTNLTFVLLEGFLLKYKGILGYSGLLNIYSLFETISDNLAIGCVERFNHKSDLSDLRREVIAHYNQAMIQKLENPQLSVTTLLEPIKHKVEQLSLFEHSLSAEKLRELPSNYVNTVEAVTLNDIEFGAWALLVANIETGSLALEQFSDESTYPLLRDHLIRRYQDMNKLMNTSQFNLDDRLAQGTSTILVSAVLSYYFAAFDKLREEQFVASDDTLALLSDTFDSASLLIRLLNDIGPKLLTDKSLIDDLVVGLETCKERFPDSESIFELLLMITENNPDMTRISKDLHFNEYNILLDSLEGLDIDEAIKQVKYILTELNTLYADHKAKLKANIERLDELLDDRSFGKLVSEFVGFHEYLYQLPHDQNSGEYAV